MVFRRLQPQPEWPESHENGALDSLVALLPQPELDQESPQPRSPNQSGVKRVERFAFDPNTVEESTLERLGLPNWLASRVVKYRNAGGQFRVKGDLQKIYGFPEGLYQELEPYINLPYELTAPVSQTASFDSSSINRPANTSQNFTRSRFRPLEPFDANLADTAQWKGVYGIGSGYAARIVKFRDGLGGFVSKGQLAEVYGLSDELIARLDSLVFVSPTFEPKQLSVNELEADSLAKHPYLKYRQAQAIVAYRNQHGDLTVDDFAQLRVLTEKEKVRLMPYLLFSE